MCIPLAPSLKHLFLTKPLSNSEHRIVQKALFDREAAKKKSNVRSVRKERKINLEQLRHANSKITLTAKKKRGSKEIEETNLILPFLRATVRWKKIHEQW